MLISFEEARTEILRWAKPLSAVSTDLMFATGSVLAEPLIATVSSPRFDNSSVDGYVLRSEDFGKFSSFRVVGQVAAGTSALPELKAGECVRIFTGAPIPPTADAVVMQEDVSASDGTIQIRGEVSPGDFVRREGEDYRAGEVLVEAGTVCTPPIVGLFAANGLKEVSVVRKPRVAFVVTGEEVVGPGERLGAGQIYDSNMVSLSAAARKLGAEVLWLLYAGDDHGSIAEALREPEFHNADVVITSGGVSVGDHDLVKDAMRTNGVEERFWRIAMRPGKPVFFGTKDSRLYFGVPGNPVSALVTFHLLVRPALLALAGRSNSDQTWPARLTEAFPGTDDRAEFVRGVASVVEQGWVVEPARGRGSHMLSGLAKANCLIHLPVDQPDLAVNDRVQISFLDWNP